MRHDVPVFRPATSTDLPMLKSLWAVCFTTDTPEDIDTFFSQIWPHAWSVIGEIGDRVVTMAHLLPASAFCDNEVLPVRYLYGGGTHPHYRGRGLYTQLLAECAKYVANRGEYALYLHPATASLVPLYKQAGFQEGIGRLPAGPLTDNDVCPLTTEEYVELRQKAIRKTSESIVCFEPAPTVAAVFLEGLSPYSTPNGTVLLSLGERIMDICPPPLTAPLEPVAMWLSTRAYPGLEEKMAKNGAYTALLGE